MYTLHTKLEIPMRGTQLFTMEWSVLMVDSNMVSMFGSTEMEIVSVLDEAIFARVAAVPQGPQPLKPRPATQSSHMPCQVVIYLQLNLIMYDGL